MLARFALIVPAELGGLIVRRPEVLRIARRDVVVSVNKRLGPTMSYFFLRLVSALLNTTL